MVRASRAALNHALAPLAPVASCHSFPPLSNRKSLKLEPHLTDREQTTALCSNRKKIQGWCASFLSLHGARPPENYSFARWSRKG
jgi:hypothetical protein